MPQQEAIAAGYTKSVLASNDHFDLELLVKPDTDFDSAFAAFDTAEGEMLKVRGWLFTIEAA
jgi:hypothetical protein